MTKLGKLIRIMGNAGLEEEGSAPDLTDKWILRHIKPGLVMAYVIATVSARETASKRRHPRKKKGQ